ncbi:MAG: FAD-dependent oxidoreductase, partial [Planctomycetota bacterium]|nr:FAD-dependent oxidoreductase [Planctomycetota bacterium]
PPSRVPATGALRDALDRIPTAPVAVVAMAFRRDQVTAPDGFGFLAPHGQGLRVLGTLYESSIFPGRAPDGIGLFRTMVGGRRDPDAVDLDDAALQELVLADLRRAWGRVPTPSLVAIHRWRLGIAQYELGHAALLQTIAAQCPPWLRLAGSGYRGVSFNACVAEGVDWAP